MNFYELLLQFFIYVYPSIFLINQVLLYKLGNKKINKDEIKITNFPMLSIIVPTKNEEIETIEGLVKNINETIWDKKKLEVIIVSDDDENYVKKLNSRLSNYEFVKVYLRSNQERIGYKSGALLYGFKRSKGELILTLDVDARLNKDSLIRAYHTILRNNCDAVTLKWVGYSGNSYSSLANGLIISTEIGSSVLHISRYNLGLKIFPAGCGTMYTRSALESINGWDPNFIQDDLEVGCRLMSKGFRICASEDSIVKVEVPDNFLSFLIQQTRWAMGTIETLIYRFNHIMKINNIISRIDIIFYLIQYTPIIFTFIAAILLFPSYFFGKDPLFSPLFILWFSSLVSYAYVFIKTGERLGMNFKEILMGLGKVSAYTVSISPFILINMIKAIRGKRRYIVTPKGKNRARGKSEKYIVLLFGIFFIIETILYLMKGAFLTTVWLFYYSLAYLYTSYYVFFKEL